MITKENEKKSRLSGKALISFIASILLCSFLIRVAIINRIHVEELELEQLVLEKSLQVGEVISKLVYKTHPLSVMAMQGNGDVENLKKITSGIIEEDPSILMVMFAPDGIVTDVYPQIGNEAILGMNLFGTGKNSKENISTLDPDVFLLDGPLDLPNGFQVLIERIPVFIESPGETRKLWGLVSVTFELPRALDEADLGMIRSQGYSYELYKMNEETGGKQAIVANVQHTNRDNVFIEKNQLIYDSDWFLRVFPVRSWYNYPENLVLIVAGFFLSFIIFFIVQNNFELKRMRGVYETMANIDVLTGIYNRRYIEENFKRVINTVSRSGGEISVIMIDVDYFKKFNDTYGHGKGDSCLKTIASTLAQTLFREEDFVARYGGEEFLVVLPLCHEKGAHKVADRLLQNIRDNDIPHEKNDVASCVTISVGVTTGHADHTRSANDYIKKADEALYMSKLSGRNKYTFLPFP